jgi:class 3 adenylate cyclase
MLAMLEERRLVTVLFGDVVGSTALGESMDAEDLRRLLGRFYSIASQVIREHDGTLEKFIGDAAMAVFGLPQAHDDDATRALDAAMDLRERLRADPLLGERLPIRIGLNTGEVVASRDPERSDFIITGDAVNVAARLQQAAEPWQILASARTASADRSVHEFEEGRELALKGKSATVLARILVGRSSAERPRATLVGREADLTQLEMVAQRAFGERRPYLVSLIAPAGTGKSRLVEELLARLSDRPPQPQIAIAQCLPYGQRLTYWPMRSLLFGIIGLGEDASPEEARLAIRRWLERAGGEHPSEDAEMLAATIGASDADVLERGPLFHAWREMLELAAARHPLVLLVEDLHWSSDSLLDLVEFILQPRGESPLLMLALSRPELLERRPTWGGGHRNHLSLALQPLDDGSIAQLVNGLLESPAPELVPIVVRRSEGNPFYAGEIVRSLLERGADLADSASVAAAAEGLPDTVQATVLARLDALDPPARRVMQLGAVLGRTFSEAGVAALSDGDARGAAVEQLVDRELIRPAGRERLTFRHIIIRDVAYGTLTRAERAILHAAAGRWLESSVAGREDERAELIAFHFREAALMGSSLDVGDDADVRASAVHWLRRAAEVAAGARGMVEAVGHLRAAIDLAPASVQPVLYERLGDFHGSGDQAVHSYAKAWQLGEEQGMDPGFLLRNLGRQLMVICRWFASVARPVSEDEIQQLVTRGSTWLTDADPRARATYLIAAASLPFWLRQSGRRAPNREDFELSDARVREGLALAEELDDPVLISAALDTMSTTPVADWGHILNLARRRTEMGNRLPLDERLDALNMVAWASAALGDLPETIRASQMAIELVQPGQNAGFSLAGASWSTYARALRGEWEVMVSAIDELRQRWIEGDRPAAAYALQGFLSGIGWARNRGEEELHNRWRGVADDIIDRFAEDHPVAALSAVTSFDLERVAAIVTQHERYPDRVHYVEHALGLCADHRHPVSLDALDSVLARADAAGMRVLGAQARRLRGVLTEDARDLAAALEGFEEIGAARYAARARAELGWVSGDEELRAAGKRALAGYGEGDLPVLAQPPR